MTRVSWRLTREGGGVQMCVSVCTQARGRLPVRLVSERRDETGAAVRLAGLRGPSLLCLELEGLVSSCTGWAKMGEGDTPEVPVTPLPPGPVEPTWGQGLGSSVLTDSPGGEWQGWRGTPGNLYCPDWWGRGRGHQEAASLCSYTER